MKKSKPAKITENEKISQLYFLRNVFDESSVKQKATLLESIELSKVRSKEAAQTLYSTLLFIAAYPDSSETYFSAKNKLNLFIEHIAANENLKYHLFNSGITGTQQCVSYSFEMAKWLRKFHREDVSLESIEATDGRILSILSVVMPKVESEILQDGNADWKGWLLSHKSKNENLLDCLIRVFDETEIRPEVKDELWSALDINLTISLSKLPVLPVSLTKIYYHQSLEKSIPDSGLQNITQVKLEQQEKNALIDCGRKILIHHLREIDPITFSSPEEVTYYHLSRGISVALYGMNKERRHPIDSYMGYVAFKNGFPLAYAGSWILFDSGRIGLNVFPTYRGGESRATFQEILRVHKHAYKLKRFTVDPYQIGKDNSDGIHSGAFWLYYHLGFRPVEDEQKTMAAEEQEKIQQQKGYRSSESALRKLAESRMELVLNRKAVRFDATDLSMVYGHLKKRNEKPLSRKLLKQISINELFEENLRFVVKNWSYLLAANASQLNKKKQFLKQVKELLKLKASGKEEDYIFKMQKADEVRLLFSELVSVLPKR